MSNTSRIEQLRRRVKSDPASFAFAALAEEYRKAGRNQEAIDTCRAGLLRHPSYTSARATLGRALLDVGQIDAAQRALGEVLATAPENLAALRGLAETYRRRGDLTQALGLLQRAAALAPQDAELRDEIGAVISAGAGRSETAEAGADPPGDSGSSFPPPAFRFDQSAPASPSATATRQVAALGEFFAAIERRRSRVFAHPSSA
jgi:tetratricopeptide (TPR) repeat protein